MVNDMPYWQLIDIHERPMCTDSLLEANEEPQK